MESVIATQFFRLRLADFLVKIEILNIGDPELRVVFLF